MATGRLGSLRRAAALSLRAMSASEASTSGRAAAAADAWDRPYSSWGAGPSPVRAQRGAWQGQQQLGVRMFSSLEALAEPHQATYHIEVVTGDVRGAGSAAPASITLYGDGEGQIISASAQEFSPHCPCAITSPARVPVPPPTPNPTRDPPLQLERVTAT